MTINKSITENVRNFVVVTLQTWLAPLVASSKDKEEAEVARNMEEGIAVLECGCCALYL